MQQSQKVIFGIGVQTLGKFLYLGISVLTIILLTRYLGVEGYGYYTIVFAYVGILGTISEFNLNNILQRELGWRKKTKEKFLSHALGLKAAFSFIILALGVVLAYFLPYPEVVKKGILISSISVYFLTLDSALTPIFQLHLRMIQREIATIIGRLFFLVLLIILIKFGLGLLFIFTASLLGNVLVFALAYFFAKRIEFFGFKYRYPYWKKIFWETFPLGLSGLMLIISFKIDSVMLSFMKSAYDVGIYGAPYKVLEVLRAFPPMFMGLILPILAKEYFEDKERYQRIFQKTFSFVLLMAMPLGIFLFIFAGPIMNFVAGPEFNDSIIVLKILALPTFFIFFDRVFANPIIAAKQYKGFLYISIVVMIFNVITNLIFIPKYSYIAAAYTTLFTELLKDVLLAVFVFRTQGLIPDFRKALRAIISALPAAFMAIIIFNHNLFANWHNFPAVPALLKVFFLVFVFVLLAAVYFITSYLLKGFDRETLVHLLKRHEKNESNL